MQEIDNTVLNDILIPSQPFFWEIVPNISPWGNLRGEQPLEVK